MCEQLLPALGELLLQCMMVISDIGMRAHTFIKILEGHGNNAYYI